MIDYRKSLRPGGPRFLMLIDASAKLYRYAFLAMALRPFDYDLWYFLNQEYLVLRESAWREFRRNNQ